MRRHLLAAASKVLLSLFVARLFAETRNDWFIYTALIFVLLTAVLRQAHYFSAKAIQFCANLICRYFFRNKPFTVKLSIGSIGEKGYTLNDLTVLAYSKTDHEISGSVSIDMIELLSSSKASEWVLYSKRKITLKLKRIESNIPITLLPYLNLVAQGQHLSGKAAGTKKKKKKKPRKRARTPRWIALLRRCSFSFELTDLSLRIVQGHLPETQPRILPEPRFASDAGFHVKIQKVQSRSDTSSKKTSLLTLEMKVSAFQVASLIAGSGRENSTVGFDSFELVAQLDEQHLSNKEYFGYAFCKCVADRFGAAETVHSRVSWRTVRVELGMTTWFIEPTAVALCEQLGDSYRAVQGQVYYDPGNCRADVTDESIPVEFVDTVVAKPVNERSLSSSSLPMLVEDSMMGIGRECSFCSFLNSADSSTCHFCNAELSYFNDEAQHSSIPRLADSTPSNQVPSKRNAEIEWIHVSRTLPTIFEVKCSHIMGSVQLPTKEEGRAVEEYHIQTSTTLAISAKVLQSRLDLLHEMKQCFDDSRKAPINFSPTGVEYNWHGIHMTIMLEDVSFVVNRGPPILAETEASCLLKVFSRQLTVMTAVETVLYGLEEIENTFPLCLQELEDTIKQDVEGVLFKRAFQESKTEFGGNDSNVEYPNAPWECSNCSYLNPKARLQCALCRDKYTTIAIEPSIYLARTDSSNEANSTEIDYVHGHGSNLLFHGTVSVFSVDMSTDLGSVLKNISRSSEPTVYRKELMMDDTASFYSGHWTQFSTHSKGSESNWFDGDSVPTTSEVTCIPPQPYKKRSNRGWVQSQVDVTFIRTYIFVTEVDSINLTVRSSFSQLQRDLINSNVTDIYSRVLSVELVALNFMTSVQHEIPPAVSLLTTKRVKTLRKGARKSPTQRRSYQGMESLFALEVQALQVGLGTVQSKGPGSCLLSAGISATMSSSLRKGKVSFRRTMCACTVSPKECFKLGSADVIYLVFFLKEFQKHFVPQDGYSGILTEADTINSNESTKRSEMHSHEIRVEHELGPWDILRIHWYVSRTRKGITYCRVSDASLQLLLAAAPLQLTVPGISVGGYVEQKTPSAIMKFKSALSIEHCSLQLAAEEPVLEVNGLHFSISRSKQTLSLRGLKVLIAQDTYFGVSMFHILRQKKVIQTILKVFHPADINERRVKKKALKAEPMHVCVMVETIEVEFCRLVRAASKEKVTSLVGTQVENTLISTMRLENLLLDAKLDAGNAHSRSKLLQRLKDMDDCPTEQGTERALSHGFNFVFGADIQTLSVSRCYLRLRNHARPLVDLAGVSLEHKMLVILAQLGATERSTSYSFWKLTSAVQGDDTIQCKLKHNGAPMKYYLSPRLRCASVEVGYGHCLRKEIKDFVFFVNSMIPKPSKALPDKKKVSLQWWDNLRYLLHGTVSLLAQSFSFVFLSRSPMLASTGLKIIGQQVQVHSLGYHRSVTPAASSACLQSKWRVTGNMVQISGICNIQEKVAEENVFLFALSLSIEVVNGWKIALLPEAKLSDVFDHYVQLHHFPGPSAELFRNFIPGSLSLQLEIQVKPNSSETKPVSRNLPWVALCWSQYCSLMNHIRSLIPATTAETPVQPAPTTIGKLLNELECTFEISSFTLYSWHSPTLAQSLAAEVQTARLVLHRIKDKGIWRQRKLEVNFLGIEVFAVEKVPMPEAPVDAYAETFVADFRQESGVVLYDCTGVQWHPPTTFSQVRTLDWFAKNTEEGKWILSSSGFSLITERSTGKNEQDLKEGGSWLISLQQLRVKYTLEIRDVLMDSIQAIRQAIQITHPPKPNFEERVVSWVLTLDSSQVRLEAERDIAVVMLRSASLFSSIVFKANDVHQLMEHRELKTTVESSNIYAFVPGSDESRTLSGWIEHQNDEGGQNWNQIVRELGFVITNTRNDPNLVDPEIPYSVLKVSFPSLKLRLESSDFFLGLGILKNLLLVPPPKIETGEKQTAENGLEAHVSQSKRNRATSTEGKSNWQSHEQLHRHRTYSVHTSRPQILEDKEVTEPSTQAATNESSLVERQEQLPATSSKTSFYSPEFLQMLENTLAMTDNELRVLKKVGRQTMQTSSASSSGRSRIITYELEEFILDLLDTESDSDLAKSSQRIRIQMSMAGLHGEHVFDPQDCQLTRVTIRHIGIKDYADVSILGGSLADEALSNELPMLSVVSETFPPIKLQAFQVNLYKRLVLSIYPGAIYKLTLRLNKEHTVFFSKYFEDDGEEDTLFAVLERDQLQHTESDADADQARSGERRQSRKSLLGDSLPTVKRMFQKQTFLQDSAESRLASGWLDVQELSPSKYHLGYLFGKKEMLRYWCELKVLSSTSGVFHLYLKKNTRLLSTKSFKASSIVDISVSEASPTSTAELGDICIRTSKYICRPVLSDSVMDDRKYECLKWVAVVLPLINHEIVQQSIMTEIFSTRLLADLYDFSKSKLEKRQKETGLEPGIQSDHTTVAKHSSNKPSNELRKKLIFINYISTTHLRLKVVMHHVPLAPGRGLPLDVSGTFTLNVPPFLLHSQLLTWQRLGKTYRNHAIKGLLRSFLLRLRRKRHKTKTSKDQAELDWQLQHS